MTATLGQDVIYVTDKGERAAKVVAVYTFKQVNDIPNPGPEGHLMVRITDGALVKPYAILPGSEDMYREMDLEDHKALVDARNNLGIADLVVFGTPTDNYTVQHALQVKQGIKPGLKGTYYVPGQAQQAVLTGPVAPINPATAG